LEQEERPAVLSDADGEFVLPVPAAGEYILWVRSLGYRPFARRFTIAAHDTLRLDISLEPFVTELEGITVYGETGPTPEIREFLSRRDLAWNFSLDWREIERLHVGTITDVLRVVPVQTRCSPIVYVDGWLKRDGRSWPLGWVYGIEIYRTYYDIPIRYRDPTRHEATCGAVLIWTKPVGGK
jgi:hypothetical protein